LIVNGDCVHVGGNDEYDLLPGKLRLLESIPLHVFLGNHVHRDDFTSTFRERTEATTAFC